MIKRSIIFIALLGAGLMAWIQPAWAQSTQPQTLSLTPFIFEERLEKGQTIQRQIELTNHSAEAVQLSAVISDFVPGTTDGQPVFVPDSQADSQYALSSWMKITAPPAKLLRPGQKTIATVQISVPKNAEEGSRYSGVLFSYSGQEAGSGTEIVKKTGTLFFIRVGMANEQGSIKNFSSDKNIYGAAAVNFVTQFQDTGNVHLKPKGNIHIYNMWGKLVAAVPINRDALIVLPRTTRSFVSAWSDNWAFGPYRAEAQVYYGDNKYEARSSTSFWILPIKGILLFLLLFAAAIALLWKGIRMYNARVLGKAGVASTVSRKSRKKK